MKFGQALQETIDRNNETQLDAAKIGFVTNSTISKVTLGTRTPANDLMQRTTKHYDEPQLFLAAQEQVTDGACTPWLNGADLHKSTVQLKTEEELSEAQAAMRLVPITKRKDQLTEVDMATIKLAIMECIEAITALTHYVAILCKEYAFSWLGLWKQHRQDLKASKYLN